ncbi:MAG TPA: ABC transporter substrate-binding protein, partial [Candidatus Acidoferrales bacterium]|nr:ABC transporter substrate-binding protein [Candidatus Acidoferrales bacterium]
MGTAGRRALSVGRYARPAWLALALVASSAALSSAAPTPMEQTRSVLERARAIVDNDKPHNEKLTQLSDLLRTFLDTDVMGKAALDQHWSKFSPAQQKEFLMLFRE